MQHARTSVEARPRQERRASARRVVEFPRQEFNFQMHRASKPGVPLFRERIISACNANFRDIVARYVRRAPYEKIEIIP